MEIMYLLVPLSVVLVFVIGVVFWMSVRGGQFDDLEGPAYRVLMDDDKPGAAPVPDSPGAAADESPPR
ncbi:MAG: cbb3-type cytochrome oxidase assembly protein CcoS [Candidatus Methylophosphatis roskildensis]|uniref:Cbb3-type cytochrome oxidase assembly protein CcoS n=1 Tax=Candidatus Methylophosphatis roskildensis TaxID=2899263 RepID=A0A9D7E840_9PROT|nr:cbb3-type cytochrome oxidase assembly protein CcoS [Candidatus Methylophosphatis roskildensis]MBK7235497.1 cbb3-type cytochrome oxidase assembly protein CcoS [Sterolibacteriaceae bacterium]MBK7663380.1 cbb3-type cytochrome oxidase assembly protein CcoS [Sterolibacteriaceae bacterium]MBK9083720.1 cbb3-type cytochrome oxidase assembly protein CcoS [Sterolibacteriaceae bacterium]